MKFPNPIPYIVAVILLLGTIGALVIFATKPSNPQAPIEQTSVSDETVSAADVVNFGRACFRNGFAKGFYGGATANLDGGENSLDYYRAYQRDSIAFEAFLAAQFKTIHGARLKIVTQ